MRILLAALAFSFMSVAMAGNDFKKFPLHGKKMQKMLRSLDLSQAQEEKLQSLHREHKVRYKALKKQMKEGQTRLSAAIAANATNQQLEVIFNEISETRAAMMSSRFKKLLTIRESLSPEQLEEFSRIFQETADKRKHW